jgi:integrase
MAKQPRLTDTDCKTLPAPERGSKVHYEGGAVPGFGLCITAAGTRSFILNYRTKNGRERRIVIGQYPSWQVKAAREEAKRLRRLVDAGGDPLANIEADREAPTMAGLIERFTEQHLPRLRPGSAHMYGLILKNHIGPYFGSHVKVADVKFADCDGLHRKVTREAGPSAANRVKAVLSRMLSLAEKWEWRDDNPARHVESNVETKRKRYLSADELKRLLAVLAEYPNKKIAHIYRLLLMTGARRGEVRAMRWADVDLEKGTWTKPASTTKQKADHVVPLSAPARQLLSAIHDAQHGARSEWVFPSRNGGHVIELKDDWQRLCKAAQITGLRTHDLRHSFASQLASGGASLPLIGALLGHADPNTTQRYAHLYDDPLRAAAEKVGAIMSGARAAAEPVPLRRKRGR